MARTGRSFNQTMSTGGQRKTVCEVSMQSEFIVYYNGNKLTDRYSAFFMLNDFIPRNS